MTLVPGHTLLQMNDVIHLFSRIVFHFIMFSSFWKFRWFNVNRSQLHIENLRITKFSKIKKSCRKTVTMLIIILPYIRTYNHWATFDATLLGIVICLYLFLIVETAIFPYSTIYLINIVWYSVSSTQLFCFMILNQQIKKYCLLSFEFFPFKRF